MRVAAVLVGVMAATAVAQAQPAEGQRRFALAQAHYLAGRYDEALVELEAARAASAEPEYLWAIAQALRLKGDCPRAIAAYGAYLRTGPQPAATRATQMLIDECTAAMPAPVADAPPLPAPAGPPAEPLVIREVQRVHTREVTLPWYRDLVGNALVGSGLAAATVGAVALVLADRHDERAAAAAGYQAFDDALRARDRDQLVGGVAIVTGATLVLGGLLHYALRPRTLRTEVLVDPATGAAGVSVAWSR